MKKLHILFLLPTLFVFFFLAPKAKADSLGGIVVHAQTPSGQPIYGASVDVTVDDRARGTTFTYGDPFGGFYTYNGSIYLPCGNFAMTQENTDGYNWWLNGVDGSHGGTTDLNGNFRATAPYTPHQTGIWGEVCFCNWTGWNASGANVGYKVTVSSWGYTTSVFNYSFPNNADTWVTATLYPVPEGNHDAASCTQTSGWALGDITNQNYHSAVHLYQTPSATEWDPNGGYIGVVTADQYRQDLKNIGLTGYQGFTASVPDYDSNGHLVKDGGIHQIWAYAFTPDGRPYKLGSTPKTISGCTLPPTLNLSANPTTINNSSTPPNSTALTWNATNASSCWAWSSPNRSKWGGSGGWMSTSGTVNDNPTSNTTYNMECYGSGGNVTKSVTINVVQPPTCSINVNPNPVTQLFNAVLGWGTNGTSATITGTDGTNISWTQGQPTSQTIDTRDAGDRTYSMTAKGPGAGGSTISSSCSTDFTVNPNTSSTVGPSAP